MANQSLDLYTDFATNASNPFFLHPSETPALILVAPPLQGSKNFQSWIRSMRIALISKNKMSFVDGSFTAPSKTHSVYNQWVRCNSMVLSWIQRSVSANVLKSIVFFDKAYDAWKDLHDRFDQGDMFRISDIQEDICRLTQGTLGISDYYTELKSLWDELENFRPLPSCQCSIPCSCGAIQSMRLFRDQDYTIRFLKGLNEEYSNVRSQIMLMDPFPPIAKAFNLVAQQERQLHSASEVDTEDEVKVLPSTTVPSVAANISRASHHDSKQGGFGNRGRGRFGRGGRSQGHQRLCTHCGRSNHTIDFCYMLHGYPHGYNSNNGARNNNSANSASISVGSEADSSTSTKNSGNFSLTPEEYNGILGLLQQSKIQAASASHSANTVMKPSFNPAINNSLVLNTNSNSLFGKKSTSWIIDTGATDHITHNFSLLIDIVAIKPITISLPNNTFVTASLAGTAVISNDLLLHHVLFVPEFHHNLLSVPQLIKTSHCYALFHTNSCSFV